MLFNYSVLEVAMWSLRTFYLNGLGYLLSNNILEQYCYIFQSN